MQEDAGGGYEQPARTSVNGHRTSTTGATFLSPKGRNGPLAKTASLDGDQQQQQQHTSVVVSADTGAELVKAERPDTRVVAEIVGCLKMKTSMLAMGACERVKKIARAYPAELAGSPIVEELVALLRERPGGGGGLGGAAMAALSVLSLCPEGRQRVCLAGGVQPLVEYIAAGASDVPQPGLDRGVTLLMNLAADSAARRAIREAGGVEALVALLGAAPLADPVVEPGLGALHNLVLLDPKAAHRGLACGLLGPLVRIAAARGAGPEAELAQVRSRLLLAELLKLGPEVEEALGQAAAELGVRM